MPGRGHGGPDWHTWLSVAVLLALVALCPVADGALQPTRSATTDTHSVSSSGSPSPTLSHTSTVSSSETASQTASSKSFTPSLPPPVTRTATATSRTETASTSYSGTISLPSSTREVTVPSYTTSPSQSRWAHTRTPLPPPPPVNVTPPFEPDLSDLEGSGASLVIGIAVGGVVFLFACVFCCCMRELKESRESHTAGHNADDIELDADGFATPT
uniref:Uncharacterized protein n=1 Tax=Neobodo designis TaxID=312471 RepID=A0A7S1QDJ5_NEODS